MKINNIKIVITLFLTVVLGSIGNLYFYQSGAVISGTNTCYESSGVGINSIEIIFSKKAIDSCERWSSSYGWPVPYSVREGYTKFPLGSEAPNERLMQGLLLFLNYIIHLIFSVFIVWLFGKLLKIKK